MIRSSKWNVLLNILMAALACGLYMNRPVIAEETSNSPTAETGKMAEAGKKMKFKDSKTLVKKDLKKGRGAVAEAGKRVTVHYTGWLLDGTKFDSSLDHGAPFSFQLGAGQVIKGWDEGVAGMKVGGKRQLTIPSDLAYGDAGAGGKIPSKATLVFDVELLKVE